MADPTGTTDSPPEEPTLLRQKLIAQALKDGRVSQDPTSGTYDDLDSAAQAFYGSIGDYDHKAEQSGAIYCDPDGKYHYSIPSAQADDNFRMRVQQTQASKLAAIFHTHPDASQSMVFSPQDVSVAQQLKVPSYIHFEHDGSMKKYIPGVTPTTRESVGANLGAKVSKGELVKQMLIAEALKQ